MYNPKQDGYDTWRASVTNSQSSINAETTAGLNFSNVLQTLVEQSSIVRVRERTIHHIGIWVCNNIRKVQRKAFRVLTGSITLTLTLILTLTVSRSLSLILTLNPIG